MVVEELALHIFFTNIVQLKRRLQQAGRLMKVETLKTLIKSMPDRILNVIKLQGNNVKYKFL